VTVWRSICGGVGRGLDLGVGLGLGFRLGGIRGLLFRGFAGLFLGLFLRLQCRRRFRVRIGIGVVVAVVVIGAVASRGDSRQVLGALVVGVKRLELRVGQACAFLVGELLPACCYVSRHLMLLWATSCGLLLSCYLASPPATAFISASFSLASARTFFMRFGSRLISSARVSVRRSSSTMYLSSENGLIPLMFFVFPAMPFSSVVVDERDRGQ
jgi:hypothetical protein